jgi:hypothetical protein
MFLASSGLNSKQIEVFREEEIDDFAVLKTLNNSDLQGETDRGFRGLA